MNSVIQTKERLTMKEFKVGEWVTINEHQEEPYQIIDIWEGDSTDSVKYSSNPSSSVFFDTCDDCSLKARYYYYGYKTKKENHE